MKYYKLEKGISKIYKITTKEDFEEKIKNNGKYRYIGKDKIMRGLALCPSCDNPVRIIGLYKKIKNQPYAQHHGENTEFAVFNPENYKHCPYANFNSRHRYDISSKTMPLSNYEKKLYYAVRNNYDKIISILNEKLDFYISEGFAKILLNDFLKKGGYRNTKTSFYNLPWALLECADSFNLIKRYVKKNSELWNFLNKREDIKLAASENKPEYDKIEPSDNNYVYLKACFITHDEPIIEDDEIVSTIKLLIADSDKVPAVWIHTESYKLNEHEFLTHCNSENEKYNTYLNIAKEIMPELD